MQTLVIVGPLWKVQFCPSFLFKAIFSPENDRIFTGSVITMLFPTSRMSVSTHQLSYSIFGEFTCSSFLKPLPMMEASEIITQNLAIQILSSVKPNVLTDGSFLCAVI